MKNRDLMTTIDMLDALKSLNDNASDYRIAQILNVNKATVSKWRNGRGGFDDETGLKVAEALGLSPEYVLACAHADRAKKDNERAAWARIAAHFQAVAATVLLTVGAFLGAPFLSS